MGHRGRSILVLLACALLTSACGTRADKAAFYDALERSGTTTLDAKTSRDGRTLGTGSGSDRDQRGGRSPTSSTTGGIGPVASSGSGIPNGVSTSIAGRVITVGLHVPITGAAPLPTNWQDSLDVVQSYIADHPIHGRTVRFVVADDGYDPAKGLAACRKLADENVLFAIGHSMPTVQESCAGLFHAKRIPYLMRGIMESTLSNRPLTYFGTPSDDLQAKLLADYALSHLGAKSKKSAIVTENDQPVSKAVFQRTIEAGGGNVVAVENSVPRQPSFGPIIQKLQSADAEIVFLNIAPVDAIKIAVQSQGSGFHPTWVGEGTHWNYNLSLEAAGTALDGAIVFSPWASVDSAGASEYKQAFARYKPNATPDDIGLIIWGWAMMARQALLDAGPSLSRYSFARALQSFEFSKPYWNPVSYTATDRRGPRAVAVFRGDGNAKRWRQIQAFTRGF